MWLLALILLGVLLWVLNEYFPTDLSSMDTAYLVRGVAILAVMSTGLLFVRDWNLKQTAKNILLWVGVAGALMLAYAYQDSLMGAYDRMRSELVPGYPIPTGAHEAMLSESDSGNYFIYGSVNGTRVRFLIDTGASDIVLSPADAARAGIDMKPLRYESLYETANGVGHGAHYVLDQLTVGNIRFAHVPVSINQAGMSSSILGMTFLRRLKSFEFHERKLTLRW